MRLLPRKSSFFDRFDEHASTLVEIARELRDMFHCFDRLQERQKRIKELEHHCDEITQGLATEVHGTFVTPLDKEDILALATTLDDVADYADAAAVRIVLYQIPESTPEARQLADLLVETTELLRDAVSCLRTTKEHHRIANACREIHRMENLSDSAYRRALGTLFNTPNIDPIAVIKWKEIYERLEAAVDKCEDASNVVQSIQLKYA
jgi:predicted phosphate transport protein (TIGR00153 family)